MTVDIAQPDPPELEAFDPNEYEDAEVVGAPGYPREELARFLARGTWGRAFTPWGSP